MDIHEHRRDKAAYAAKVIAGNREQMERLGVAPELIDREVAYSKGLFRLSGGERKVCSVSG